MEKRIATYGTFDTLHYGHVRLLKRAKSLGHFLIVGLSTDEFNSEKGKEAKFNFTQRIEDLSGVGYIDMIIPETHWEQKRNDIQKHQIDILVMGDDWQGKFDHLPCQVVYLPRTPDISSTEMRSL